MVMGAVEEVREELRRKGFRIVGHGWDGYAEVVLLEVFDEPVPERFQILSRDIFLEMFPELEEEDWII